MDAENDYVPFQDENERFREEHKKMLEQERQKRRADYDKNNKEFIQNLKKKVKIDESNIEQDAQKECQSCREHYSTRRRRFACPYLCGFEACTPCHTQYLKDKTTEWHCMNCRRELDCRLIKIYFTQKQQQELNAQRKILLLAKDEAQLPVAQLVLEERMRRDAITRQIEELQIKIGELRDLRDGARPVERKTADTKEGGVPIKCPLGECRGYMKRGVCGLCQKRICLKCMQQVIRKKDGENLKNGEILNETEKEEEELKQHVCDPEHVANLKCLRSTSKMCPKCGIWTQRSEGCNQMWCVNCHVAWDWSTNKEIQGAIHNPHYFEWQLKTQGTIQRNPNDVLCGGLPRIFNREWKDYEFLNAVLRCVQEIREYRTRPREPNNQDTRIMFLEKKIDKDKWANTILQRDKKFRVRQQFFNVHQMFQLAGTDILQRRHTHQISAEQAKQELNALRLYYNKELLKLATENKGRYKRFYSLISANWAVTDWRDSATVAECLEDKN